MPGWSGRVKLAILLMLLYAAATSLARAREIYHALRSPPTTDEITRYERRMVALRDALPPGGVVGYVTDPPLEDTSSTRVAVDLHDRFKAYLLAQYVLAPRVMVADTAREWVVGNYREDGTAPSLPGYHIVREFGRGLVLYRRITP
jgi:hypothetical protein